MLYIVFGQKKSTCQNESWVEEDESRDEEARGGANSGKDAGHHQAGADVHRRDHHTGQRTCLSNTANVITTLAGGPASATQQT